ncbi:MAG: PAS domain S-box protein [Candidatus Aminicenantes bacterium]|nr:PAS domain S-box protein [Candidatus Aminicenantes bacterium]
MSQLESRSLPSNDLLDAVTEGLDVIIAALDLEFHYIFFNRAYREEIKRLTGRDLRIGMRLADLFADIPEQGEIARREWTRSMAGESVNQRIEFGDPARHRRVYMTLKSPLRDAEGRIWGAKEIAYDFTDQAKAAEALRERESGFRRELEKQVAERTAELAAANEKLQREAGDRQRIETALSEKSRILEAFFATSINPMVILDKDFNFLQVNDAYAKACQKEPSEFLGHNHFEFYPNPENEAIFRRVVASNVSYQAQAKPFSFPDHPEWGVSYWDWILSVIPGLSGEAEFLVFSLLDVTARTLALDQIKQNEELLREVLEILPVGVWITDPSGKIRQGNLAALDIWRGARYVGPDQFGEYRAWRVDTGERIEPDEWAAARAIANGETTLNEEVEIECFDGSRKFILNSAMPIRSRARDLAGVIIVNQDITEQRKREASLRSQAAALDLAHDAIFDCALDGTILSWNHGAEMMYGWTKAEALGQISHLFLKSGFPEPIERITETIVREGRWDGEFSQISRFGVPLEAAGRWALRVDAQGRPAGILKINIDITESKKAEHALKASSQYTRSLIEASLDPQVTISPEGKITDVNRATELVTEVPRCSLIGSDFSDYFTQPEKAREGYRRAFSAGAVRDYPLAIRSASGGVTEVLYNATVYRNESGEVQGVIAAARDITERKKAEEERLRLVKALEQAAEGIVIMDTGLEILYVNPAFEKISGLRSDDILRSTYGDILRMSGDTDGLENRIKGALKRSGRWNGHMIRRKKDGLSYELDVIFSPMLDEAGKAKNFVAVERDVTEEVRIQEHLRQGQKMEALGTLAGGIAHDFNNILMPILINTEMSLADVSEAGAVSGQLKMVLEAANRGKDLVKQIIAFSRRKEPEKNPVKVSAIFKEGLRLLRASIPKNIEIVDGIADEAFTVLADATQIHQILMNLCSNAAYAMREKGGILDVRLTAIEAGPDLEARNPDIRPGPYLRLVVSDSGCGMTPAVKARIFDPFFTTKGPGEGSGMGLPVVHGIVNGLGGAIVVRSEVGKGSDFEVFLPRIEGRVEALPEAPSIPAVGRGRILFIDDEEILGRSVVPMLERLGYQVTAESDAGKALEAFRRGPDAFDLAITDQTMPSLTGESLSRELWRLCPDLPIILCTGFSDSVDEDKAKALGFAGFLMKPFSMQEIARAIDGALRANH